MIVLGVETSCDETSVAIVKDGKEILANVVSSQIDVHKEYGGVVPEIASRCHTEVVTCVFEKALNDANLKPKDIDLVAVTEGPGLIGALLIGISAATAFAYANNIPIIGVNHLAGHIYANNLENELKFPCLALVVSGGHTELVLMEKHNSYKQLGQTLDDAVGESYDKVGRVIGVPYPGGPVIDKLAHQGKDVYNFPRVYLDKEGFDFSFSGLKSAIINFVHNAEQRGEEINKIDVCASFQEAVTDVLVYKTHMAAKKYNVKQIIIAGGVAANKGLREKLLKEITEFEICMPSIKYCTDNAAMIASLGYFCALDGYKDRKFDIDGIPYLDF